MIWNLFRSRTSSAQPKAASTATAPSQPRGSLRHAPALEHLVNGEAIPAYPSNKGTLPAASVEDLLATQKPLIDNLYRTIGFEREFLDVHLRPVIARYASYVHLLPASEHEHHSGPGGLLRHGIEAAKLAAQFCNGLSFANDVDAERRRLLRPRWIMAAVYGALLHDIAKPFVDIGAISEDGSLEWSPIAMPLSDWLARKGLEHYCVIWRPGLRSGRHDGTTLGISAVREILGPDVREWLSEVQSDHITEALHQTIHCDPSLTRSTNPIWEAVKHGDQESCRLDNERARNTITTDGGNNMRRLAGQYTRMIEAVVADNGAKINVPGGYVFVTTMGTFASRALFEELSQKITREKHKGLPTHPDAVVPYLMRGAIIEPHIIGHKESQTWEINIDYGEATRREQLYKFSQDRFLFGPLSPPPPIHASFAEARHAVAHTAATTEGANDAEDGEERADHNVSTTPLQPAPSPESSDPAQSVPSESDLPIVIDRRESRRDAEEQRERQSQRVVLTDASDAEEFFKKAEGGGESLLTIASRIKDGASLRWGDHAFQEEGIVQLAWPGAFENLGMRPEAAVKKMIAKRLIQCPEEGSEALPIQTNAASRSGEVIALSETASEAFVLCAPNPGPEASATPVTAEQLAQVARTRAPKKTVESLAGVDLSTMPAHPEDWEAEKPSIELVHWIRIQFYQHLVETNNVTTDSPDFMRKRVTKFSELTRIPVTPFARVLLHDVCGPRMFKLTGKAVTERDPMFSKATRAILNEKFLAWLDLRQKQAA